MGARRVVTLRWACDPDFHRPIRSAKAYDVSFVGTFYWNRWRLLRKLKVKPHVFGSMWYLKAGYHHPSVQGEDYIRVINRTKVNINIHHPVDLAADAPNMRTFELAGSAAFFLTEKMDCLGKLFRRVETYTGEEELNEKIEYYLENDREREEIAAALREDCLEKHTYLYRAQELMKLV
jgi:spore maturation protein CgeB